MHKCKCDLPHIKNDASLPYCFIQQNFTISSWKMKAVLCSPNSSSNKCPWTLLSLSIFISACFFKSYNVQGTILSPASLVFVSGSLPLIGLHTCCNQIPTKNQYICNKNDTLNTYVNAIDKYLGNLRVIFTFFLIYINQLFWPWHMLW